MVKAVVFDFDGTVADTFHIVVEAINDHAKELGYKKIKDPDSLRSKEAREVITQELGIPLWKIPFYLYFGKQVIQEKIKKASLFPGIKEVIKELGKKHLVGILTSNSKDVVETVLKKHKVKVDFIITDKTVIFKQAAFIWMFGTQKILPKDCIYVADEVRDVKACKLVGMKMIGVGWGYNSVASLKENGVDHIALTPSRIVNIVKKG